MGACTQIQSDSDVDVRSSLPLKTPRTSFKAIDIHLAQENPSELHRALTMPYALVVQHIGAHVLQGQSSVKILDANQTLLEEMSDDLSIHIDSQGQFHATLDNSDEYGHHVILKENLLYSRPRFGPYYRRAPRRGESDEILATLTSSGRDYFAALTHTLRLRPGSATTLEGRQVYPIAFEHRDSPSHGDALADTDVDWRKHASVTHAKGMIHIDLNTGVVLQHDFNASLSFLKNNRRFTMLLRSHQAMTQMDQPIQIEPPPKQEIGSFIP